MKKIIALVLCVLLVTPSAAFAINPPPGFNPAAPPPIDSSLPGAPGAPNAGLGQGFDYLDTTNSTVGCQTGGHGGSLAQNFAGTVKQWINSFIRSNLGDIAGRLSEAAGPLGGLVDKLVSFGLDKFSGVIDQVVDDVLGGVLNGPVGDALAGIFGGDASSIISGIMGGDIGGIIGGVTGGGFGLAVPVNTVSINTPVGKIDKQTKATQDATETAAQKDCVGDVAIKQAAIAAKAELDAKALDFLNRGLDGQSFIIENIPAHFAAGQEAVFKDFIENQTTGICAPSKAPVQQLLADQFEYQTDFGARVQCTGGGAEAVKFQQGNVEHQALYDTLWNDTLAWDQYLLSYEQVFKQIDTYTEAEKLRIQANGQGQGKVVCGDGSKPVSGYCVGNSGVDTVTFEFIKAPAIKATIGAQEDLGAADEIGELIKSSAANLIPVAFNSLFGLLTSSLQQGPQGSYLDDMVADSGGQAITAVQTAVESDIEGALQIEEAYLERLNTVAQFLTQVRTKYNSVKACYQQKIAAGVTTPGMNLSQKLTNASSTIAIIINPEIQRINTEMTASYNAIAQLDDLLSDSETATDVDEVIEINRRFNMLLQSGINHTAAELTALENELETSGDALDFLAADANAQLTACQAL